MWETTYYQVLSGPDPVANWVAGSRLRPLLDALPSELSAEFFRAYAARAAVAYPPQADRTTVLPFRRLFLICRSSAGLP